MTAPEKKAALAELAAGARSKVVEKLGPELANSFLGSTPWFDGIAAGTAVKFEGRTTLSRSVDSNGSMTLKFKPASPP